MYYNIGRDFMVRGRSVIGIFDLDNTTYSRATRAFLQAQSGGGALVELSVSLPKSFLLATDDFGQPVVYVNDMASRALLRRLTVSEHDEKAEK